MMQYTTLYQSPLGQMFLAADDIGLMGAWFCGQKYYAYDLAENYIENEPAALTAAKQWLDIYFAGKEPNFLPPIHMTGTPFQMMVWDILQKIPYGCVVTYGEIAKEAAQKKGLAHMSAQAVGNAVGHNKISILVPCHRVVGADGDLTGYAGGITKKQQLLAIEGIHLNDRNQIDLKTYQWKR